MAGRMFCLLLYGVYFLYSASLPDWAKVCRDEAEALPGGLDDRHGGGVVGRRAEGAARCGEGRENHGSLGKLA